MSSDAQNIYDNAEFFSAYSTLPRSQQGLDAAPEWPILQNMVLGSNSPSDTPAKTGLKGCRVLDLGCGYGWFARWVRDAGAEHIQAIDISRKMIRRAMEFEADTDSDHPKGIDGKAASKISYEIADFETVTISDEAQRDAYDIVYSSLTFHYLENLGRLFREIHASLRKPTGVQAGGKLVFSVEHPIFSAPIHPGPEFKVLREGDQERPVWPLNCYNDEGWRVTTWLEVEGIKKYHRTVESYVRLLLESGFTLTGLKDWVPSEEDVAKHPEWEINRHRPYFLLISAEVRG